MDKPRPSCPRSKSVAIVLLTTLAEAAATRASGNCGGAADDYEAFINQANGQSGKGITAAAATILIGDAQYLIAHCP